MRTAAVYLSLALGILLLLPSHVSAQGQRSPTSTLTVNPDGTATVTVTGPGAPPSAASRVIVRFRNGATFLPGSGRSVALSASTNIHRVDNPPGLSVDQVISRYRGMPNVLYAEPDYTVSAILLPTEPNFATTQWDMTKIASPQAWDLHTDSGDVVVAVIDTGIDFDHPDLKDNIYNSDSNPVVHGYSCMGGACVAGGLDNHGHGTHVAGTIGAAMNGVGVVGLNWKVQLLSIKFLGSGGSGSISDAVLGFDLLRSLKQSGVNIRVTNNSWGGGGYSQALKDAMAALEEAVIADDGTVVGGTLNVCAAGNSGLNADNDPMYPAAYDNRGIVSVLATDSNDAGASFTNFGLASVDIAAPGVNTLSTSPTGTCSLCDATGYRTLSGTSMASPHVAGVAAALLSRNPSLTAPEARDALLHPGSYDWMTDLKAQSTSSGGRLNFFKALTNYTFLDNPVLNNFPTVAVSPDVFTSAGGVVNFTATTSDPDSDPLRTASGRGAAGAGSTWLFGWELNQVFPATLPFNAPGLARTGAMSYDTAVSDNRGGGAAARSWAVVAPVATPGGVPTGTLTVPATGTINAWITIGFAPVDPDGQPVAWDIWASGNGGSFGGCCYTGSTVNVRFSSPGAYRISAQAIDRELHTSTQQTALISIDGRTGVPPIAQATLDKQSGPVPLTVNINMSGSSDPDGSISSYFINCGGGYTTGTTGSTGNCTFSSPGTYWLLLQVQDNQGFMGLISKYVVVTPPGDGPPPPSDDTTPPSVSIANPASGASLAGTVSLQSTASDNAGGSGVKEVEYYLDSTAAGSSLGKVGAPYTLSWNTSGVTPGAHTIYAIARDNAGNVSQAASVAVNVNVVMPTVALSASATSVKKKATVQLTAVTNTPTYPVQRVDFLVGGVVACSDTSAPYGCSWKAPAATRSYQAQALAYDDHGNVGTSNSLTITVK